MLDKHVYTGSLQEDIAVRMSHLSRKPYYCWHFIKQGNLPPVMFISDTHAHATILTLKAKSKQLVVTKFCPTGWQEVCAVSTGAEMPLPQWCGVTGFVFIRPRKGISLYCTPVYMFAHNKPELGLYFPVCLPFLLMASWKFQSVFMWLEMYLVWPFRDT